MVNASFQLYAILLSMNIQDLFKKPTTIIILLLAALTATLVTLKVTTDSAYSVPENWETYSDNHISFRHPPGWTTSGEVDLDKGLTGLALFSADYADSVDSINDPWGFTGTLLTFSLIGEADLQELMNPGNDSGLGLIIESSTTVANHQLLTISTQITSSYQHVLILDTGTQNSILTLSSREKDPENIPGFTDFIIIGTSVKIL